MKKATIRRVLDVLTTVNSSGSDSGKLSDDEVMHLSNKLSPDSFQACKVSRHGFPYKATCLAFDPIQSLIAIGNQYGSIHIYGQQGIDANLQHEANDPVVQLVFLVNEGALLSICSDGMMHLWNLRQKVPAILHSLKFNRDRVTCCCIPYQSKWIYIGTERGNVHLCSVENFVLSGYSINWNKAIELSQTKHPGAIMSLCDHPLDENKLLLAYRSGFIALWDLKAKSVDQRYYGEDKITSVSWHSDGKQFMCAHDNGNVSLWNYRSSAKPQQVLTPHAKSVPDASETYGGIDKLEWATSKNSADFIIFSGGLPATSSDYRPSMTVMQGKSVTVLEMDFPVVDFITLVSTPWKCDFQDPYGLAILLEKELVVVDLDTPGYPCIESAPALDIHDSPVTSMTYVLDEQSVLFSSLYQFSQSKVNPHSTSKKVWPLKGGEWASSDMDIVPELIVTGHADGSVRFWDASAISLKSLYKLRTYKVFEKKSAELDPDEEDPFRITNIAVCPESQMLVVSNSSSSVMTYKFSNGQQVVDSVPCLYVNHFSEMILLSGIDEQDLMVPAMSSLSIGALRNVTASSANTVADGTDGANSAGTEDEPAVPHEPDDVIPHGHSFLKMKTEALRQHAGMQIEMVCLLLGTSTNPPSDIVSIAVNGSCELLCFSTLSTLCIVDIQKRQCILNMLANDVHVTSDKLVAPKSPLRAKLSGSGEPPSSFTAFDTVSPTGIVHGNFGFDVAGCASTERMGSGIVLARRPGPSRANELGADSFGSLQLACVVILPPQVNDTFNDHGNAYRVKTHNDQKPCFYLVCGGPHVGDPKSLPGTHQASTGGVRSHREASTSSCSSANSAFKSNRPQFKLMKKNSSMSFDKSMDNSASIEDPFSRASSVADIELSELKESVTFMTFAPSLLSINTTISLWAGTNNGTVFSIILNVNQCRELSKQPGRCLYARGAVVYCALMDQVGNIISSEAGRIKDAGNSDAGRGKSDAPVAESQFLCVATERQMKLISLPSESCNHYHNVDMQYGIVVRSIVETVAHGTFLASYTTSGNILVFSLPSFTMFFDSPVLKANDIRISTTFQFAPQLQCFYLANPSEIQRMTCLVETYDEIQEIASQLFVPHNSPERPSHGFFKGLFGDGYSSLDREELFGKNSGTASRGVATKSVPAAAGERFEALSRSATGLSSDMQRLRLQAVERGEKLGEVEERTQQLHDSSKKFSSNAHALMLKYKNKKWYQL